MKFYLFYKYGSCNDGSHSCGLEEYPSLEEAKAAGQTHGPQCILEGGYMAIIEGDMILQEQWA